MCFADGTGEISAGLTSEDEWFGWEDGEDDDGMCREVVDDDSAGRDDDDGAGNEDMSDVDGL